jgi:lycopene cyclase domain-containing protein
MDGLSYLALLAGCLLATAPLEFLLRTRVYARWRRLLIAIAPGLLLGVSWDRYAVAHRQWSFDRRYLSGLRLAGLPIEEVLFFVVIPVCAVLTLEAVRRRRPGWLIGDERLGDEPIGDERLGDEHLGDER